MADVKVLRGIRIHFLVYYQMGLGNYSAQISKRPWSFIHSSELEPRSMFGLQIKIWSSVLKLWTLFQSLGYVFWSLRECLDRQAAIWTCPFVLGCYMNFPFSFFLLLNSRKWIVLFRWKNVYSRSLL